MNARSSVLPVAALLTACAVDEPAATAFDRSAGQAEVEVAGDGFGRLEGERLPLDAIVLRLRQQMRTLSADQRARFVVRLRLHPGVAGDEAAAAARAGMNRLVDEAWVMGVRQIEYL